MDYYEKEHEAYFIKTVSVDPAPFLETFIQIAPKGATVWDIGCGSGRDLRWLKERGFHAVGLERSSGLARLARRYSGCEVIEADFESFDFSGINADGMLMTAALVHLHWDKFEIVLREIIRGVKPDGIVYISLKKGDRAEKRLPLTDSDSRRVFYMWQPVDLEKIFHAANLEVILSSETASLINTGEIWLGYFMRRR